MNIYVGNLSYETTEEDLKEAFGAFGEVSTINIIKDKFSDRSKGFGFVEMTNKSEAQSAIEGLNGKDLKGRSLNISEARPRSEGQGRRSGGSGGRPGGGPGGPRRSGGGPGQGGGNRGGGGRRRF